MTLGFPNPSRSYDANHHRIRFWAHDGAQEVTFFIEDGAIFKIAPRTGNAEAAILAAFDAARDRIMAAAAKVFSPSQPRAFYVLASGDF
ncbi:MAG: DUF1488 family protein [Bauldia sp.]